MLELREVSYRYPGIARPALEGVELAVGDGEIVGLAGPNGSGKSTLCLLAAGVAPGSIGGELRGDVLLDGRSLRGRRPYELASSIGLVFANPHAQRTRVASTVFEEVAFGPMNLGLPTSETVGRTKSALAAMAIEDLAERHPDRLSGGQTQLVAIASMLAMQQRQLILDEPVAELDPDGRELVVEALRRVASSGTGVLIAEHGLDVLSRLSVRVVHLDGGRIAPAQPKSPTSAAPAEPRPQPTRSDAPVAIRCSGLEFTYPDGTRALDGIDLTIPAGEPVAITGRNGSGKTTLVRTWNGLLRQTAGSIEVAGKSTAGQRVATLARSVGLTFQDPNEQIFAGTCREAVALGARNIGLRGDEVDAAVDEALDAVGLSDEAGTNPYDIGASRRRLLAIASVLAMRTPIVVLDEPTMGLDISERARVGSIVASLAAAGRTVVAISHDARFVAGAFDRSIVIDRGRFAR